MKTLYFLVLSCLAGTLAVHAAEDYRTFTSTDGASMQARILEVSGYQVTIERDDMRRFTVAISMFSDDDQKYIKQWAEEAAKVDVRLSIETFKRKGKVRKSEQVAIEIEEFPAYYEVEVFNETFEEITNLKAKYTIIHYKSIPGSTTPPTKESKSGEAMISKIAGRSKVSFSTESFESVRTELENGYYWTSGADDKSKDGLGGIWVKFYYEGEMVSEYKYPADVDEDVKWGETSESH